MAEHRLIDALAEVLVVLVHKVVHSSLSRDKLNGRNIIQRLNAALDRFCLILIRDILVDERDDLVLVFKVFYQSVNVDGQQGYAAHDNKARHDDRDRREGHETVGRNASEALADKIAAPTQSHNCNTHPFRH